MKLLCMYVCLEQLLEVRRRNNKYIIPISCIYIYIYRADHLVSKPTFEWGTLFTVSETYFG